ncbi:hypothetical protein CDD80_1026 [Ophiocordyceps camponoti-rufipedis]|uniref:Uncharacterized protein n=1 Tax=Ophiocordyceps camponoti-rufipedis TaxID=2004952 RepID=A0A2C5ZB13_9HYPO|nr:hypothetical protein CDD80_1026 [Ophiocordyceps camponoti-rufipedis]
MVSSVSWISAADLVDPCSELGDGSRRDGKTVDQRVDEVFVGHGPGSQSAAKSSSRVSNFAACISVEPPDTVNLTVQAASLDHTRTIPANLPIHPRITPIEGAQQPIVSPFVLLVLLIPFPPSDASTNAAVSSFSLGGNFSSSFLLFMLAGTSCSATPRMAWDPGRSLLRGKQTSNLAGKPIKAWAVDHSFHGKPILGLPLISSWKPSQQRIASRRSAAFHLHRPDEQSMAKVPVRPAEIITASEHGSFGSDRSPVSVIMPNTVTAPTRRRNLVWGSSAASDLPGLRSQAQAQAVKI